MHTVRIIFSSIVVLIFSSLAFCWDMVDVTFAPVGGGTVTFSHASHLKNPKIDKDDCGRCHAKLLDSRKRPVSMAEMYRGRSCGGCHGKTAFTLNACDSCHLVPDVTFKVPVVGNVEFPHDPHTKNRSCWECHPKLFKAGRNKPVTMAEMEKGRSCGACHNGKKIFPLVRCERCHLAKDLLIKVNGAGPVTFSHDIHTGKLKYGCSDCHPRVFRLGYKRTVVTMYEMDYGESCGWCHDGSTAFTIRENCVRCHDQ